MSNRQGGEMESVASSLCSETFLSALESVESFCSAEPSFISVDGERVTSASDCGEESLLGNSKHLEKPSKVSLGEEKRETEEELSFGSVLVTPVYWKIKHKVMDEPREDKAVKKSWSKKLTLLKFSFTKRSRDEHGVEREEGGTEKLYENQDESVNMNRDVLGNVRTEDVVITTQVDSQNDFESEQQIELGVDSPLSANRKVCNKTSEVAMKNNIGCTPSAEKTGNLLQNEMQAILHSPKTTGKAEDLCLTFSTQEIAPKCSAGRETDSVIKARSSDDTTPLQVATEDGHTMLNLHNSDTIGLAAKEISCGDNSIVNEAIPTEPPQCEKERVNEIRLYGLTRRDMERLRENLDRELPKDKPVQEAFIRSIHSFDGPVEYFLSLEAALVRSGSSLQMLELLSRELGQEHPLVKEVQLKLHLAEVKDIDMFLKRAIDDSMSRRIFTENPAQYVTVTDYYKTLESTASTFGSSLIPALREKLGSDHPLIEALKGSVEEGNVRASVDLPVSQGGILTQPSIDMEPGSARFAFHGINVNKSAVHDEASISRASSSWWGCMCLRP